jgi:hypothetical protein
MEDAKRHSRFNGKRMYYKYTYCPRGISFLGLVHTAFYHGQDGYKRTYIPGEEGWVDAP